MIVTDDRVLGFAEAALGTTFLPPCTVMGWERDGEIVSAVVFNNYTGPNVEVTAVGASWPRSFMREIGRYVFTQLGCLRLTFTVEDDAVAAYAMRLGGRVEGLMRDYFGPGRDATIIGILKADWPIPHEGTCQ